MCKVIFGAYDPKGGNFIFGVTLPKGLPYHNVTRTRSYPTEGLPYLRFVHYRTFLEYDPYTPRYAFTIAVASRRYTEAIITSKVVIWELGDEPPSGRQRCSIHLLSSSMRRGSFSVICMRNWPIRSFPIYDLFSS